MVSCVLIILFRNISTIGLLKSLGMTTREVSGVFLRKSASIVGRGLLVGNAFALLICTVQKYTHYIKFRSDRLQLAPDSGPERHIVHSDNAYPVADIDIRFARQPVSHNEGRLALQSVFSSDSHNLVYFLQLCTIIHIGGVLVLTADDVGW